MRMQLRALLLPLGFTFCVGVTLVPALAPSDAAGAPRRAPMPARMSSPRPEPSPTENAGLQFRSIGPAISGGRVAAVVGSNNDSSLYYAGAGGGGVWKSTSGGASWTNVWAKQPLASIGAIAIDPHDDNVVWVGSGEANPRNDLSWGDGLWRSGDGGKTWRRMGLDATSQIARVSINPNDSKELVVAALGNPWADSQARGIYRTTDGGKNWSQTLYVDPVTGAADLARDPHDPKVLFASLWRFRREPWYASSGGGASGLYRSSDGGAHWSRIQGHGFPGGPVGRIGIAIAPNNSKRVYAVVQSREGTIWRSDDDGASWKRVSSDTMPDQRPFYFSHLTVDPHDPNHVIAVSMYLSESKDGGRTWKHLTGVLHPDNHAFWWSADGKRMINGNDGGVAYSDDAGKTWIVPYDMPVGQIYHVGYDLGDPYTVCGGFQDNSTWCGPSNSLNGIGIIDRDWSAIAGGDGTWAIPDPADPSRIWTDTQDGVLTIFDRKANQAIDVEPWPRDAFTSLDSLARAKYRFNWNSPLAFSPQDPHVAYFGGDVVFRTSDAGRTWTAISPDLTRNEKNHQIASGGPIELDVSGAEYYDTLLVIAPSAADAKTIWAGSDDGLIHVTRDGGATWNDVTPKGLPKYARVESIDLSPADAGVAYVAIDRHDLGDRAPYVFATSDGGATWRRIDAGLPRDGSSHVVRVDPKNPHLLYAGTERGIWYSMNDGAAWTRMGFDSPSAPVYDLQIHPVANDLLVATHGRSFWILDDLTPLQQAGRAGNGPYLFPLRPGTNWNQWPPIEGGDGGSLSANFYVGPNPKGPALITFWQKAPAKAPPSIEISDASGRVVRHLAGSYKTDDGTKYWVSNASGYNRLAWDGNEDGPARWNGTTLQNAGPLTGAEALPGTYQIKLIIAGKTFVQPFVLRGDPRMTWTDADLAERHAFLSALYADVDKIDRLLNTLDAREKALLKQRGPNAAKRLAALRDFRNRLTADDRRDEDSVSKPDKLRERVFAALGAIGSSRQPPFAAHRGAAAEVQADVDAMLVEGKALLESST
jgi:photosystem II stability/assembly factor-like uncharacterized protein